MSSWVASFDHVPFLDRPLGEQQQTADEVADEGLRAEADADREGAPDHGERGEGDVDHLKRE